MTATRALTGDDLTLADVWEVAVEGRAAALLSSEARDQMQAARRVVEQVAHGANEHTYGVNTGFGRFVSRQIPEELTEELQLRLLRSHAAGVGDPYPAEIVRAAMLLRANALAKGNSGARIETVENACTLPIARSCTGTPFCATFATVTGTFSSGRFCFVPEQATRITTANIVTFFIESIPVPAARACPCRGRAAQLR